MTLISNNIKYLRKKYKLTQEQFAEKIGIKRSLVGAYEEGRADPRIPNLINMAQLFSVSVDSLISLDLTQGYILGASANGSADNLKVLAITVDKNSRENIELVPQKAAAGYLNGFSDPEYLAELPKFQLPMLSSSGTFRAFEISGDSMLPLPSGSVIIGRYVESLNDIINGRTYILVTQKEGVVYKRIFNYVKENGKLFLVSDNPVYSPFEVPINEVFEIWEAKAYICLQFPDSRQQGADMTLEKLATIVLEMQQEISRLKDKQIA